MFTKNSDKKKRKNIISKKMDITKKKLLTRN